MDPVVISDWYELVKGDDLMQGDLIDDCPVFRPPENIDWPIKEGEAVDMPWESQNVIVMSQSCDIAKNQKSDMRLATLCQVWKFSEVEKSYPSFRSDFVKEECRRGHMFGYCLIQESNDDRFKREISIVSFREMFGLPLTFVRNLAKARGLRPRLRSPYREHLSQAFGIYFMRVAINGIPPFRSKEKYEDEVMRKLTAMDSEARKRILECLPVEQRSDSPE